MTVTALKSLRKSGVGLEADGEFVCALHPDAAGALSVGDEITAERIEELDSVSRELRAKEYALRLLSMRSYTRKMLTEKLAAREGQAAARIAADRMEQLGLLNDADYAARLASDCMERRGFSATRAAIELSRKGISREIIEMVLYDEEQDDFESLIRVIKKKRPVGLDTEKGYRKAYNTLLRLGYRHGDIRTVLRHLQEDEDYYDDYDE